MMILPMPMSDDDSSNADERNRNKRDASNREIDALPMSDAIKDSRYRQDSKDSRSRQDNKDSRSRQDNGDSHSRQDSRDSSRSDDNSSNADEKNRNKRDASYRDLDELPRSDAVKDSRSLQNSKDSRSRQDSGDSSRSDDDSSNADEKNRNKRDAAYRDSYKAANDFPEANVVKGTSSYGGGSVSVGGGTLQGEMTDSADEAKASAPEAAKTVEDSPRADAVVDSAANNRWRNKMKGDFKELDNIDQHGDDTALFGWAMNTISKAVNIKPKDNPSMSILKQ